jgi:predicted NBD/HSP70 family sugar kinase
VLRTRRHERAFPLPKEALTIIRDDIAALRRAIPLSERGRLAGIGLAMPYNIGSWRRELDIPAETCAAWNDFDLAGRLRAVLDLPVFVENDGTAVAMAELFKGHGRELDDFAVVYIGTAVGGGVVLGGTYRRGITGNAGDIGLMLVPPSRLATAPKPRRANDILLTRASISSLIRHLRLNGVTIVTARDLENAIAGHATLVGEWLEDCADALINPIMAVAALLDLQAIVIDGNLPRNLIEWLVSRLRVLIAENVPEAREPPSLLVGSIGPNAAALGAAILPLHSNYGPDQEMLFGQ